MVPRWNGLGRRARVSAAVRCVLYPKMLWGYPPEGLQARPCSVLSQAPALLTSGKLLGDGVCPPRPGAESGTPGSPAQRG